MALSAKWKMLMALNTELRRNNDSEHQMKNADSSECRDWEEIVALNADYYSLSAIS